MPSISLLPVISLSPLLSLLTSGAGAASARIIVQRLGFVCACTCAHRPKGIIVSLYVYLFVCMRIYTRICLKCLIFKH